MSNQYGMQKLFTLFISLAFLCLIGSCEESEPGIESKLAGRWELMRSYNGWGGSENYPPGNGNIMEFTKKTYKFINNDTLTKQGQYVIIQAKSFLTGEKEDMILFDITAEQAKKNGHIGTMIEINHNELGLSFDAFDGPSAYYQKIQ